MNWNNVYKENIELDKMFYDTPSIDIIKKNKLELLVEIGALANEPKCFKYWSFKNPIKEKILEELADCFIMCLSFFNYLKLDLDIRKNTNHDNIIDLFFKLYELGLSFSKDEREDDIKEFFNNLLILGFNLGFTEEEMISSCLKKIIKNKERIRDGY